MKVDDLVPAPTSRENFRRNRQIFIPTSSGCYALTTFQGEVLYVGLTKSLRRRQGEHLDDPSKTAVTEKGRATFFYWYECENVEQVERTWQNMCLIQDGRLPILNSLSSPVAV